SDIRADAQELHQAEKRRGTLSTQIAQYRRVAAAAESPKALGVSVRDEVIDVMKGVEPRMRAFYEHLYGDDRLTFDTVTTGHAANPRVKSELNVYLRAGDERVPIGPYSNAGRMRALTLSFVFALLERSAGSLKLLIL